MNPLFASLPAPIQPLFLALTIWLVLVALVCWVRIVVSHKGGRRYYGFEAYRFLVSFLGGLIFLWSVCRLLGTVIAYDGFWWVSGVALAFALLFPKNLRFHWTSFNPASGLNMTDLAAGYAKQVIPAEKVPQSGLVGNLIQRMSARHHLNSRTAALFAIYVAGSVVSLGVFITLAYCLD